MVKRETTKSVQVVYIMGSGRSGSTLLDRLIGSHPSIVSLGEFVQRFKDNRIYEVPCSCGELGRDCPFWSTVLEQWLAHPDVQDLPTYHHLRQKFDRLSSLPRLLRERSRPSPDFQRYVAQTQALYRTLQDVSNMSMIVDSSKEPVRAFALASMPAIDLKVIHLVRDGRGVAWSFKKSVTRNQRTWSQHKSISKRIKATLFSLNSSAYMLVPIRTWVLMNLLSDWVRYQLGTSHAALYRYEDIVEEPERFLLDMGSFLGLDLQQVVESVINGSSIGVGHMIGGNWTRMSKSIKLRSDIEWTEKLSPIERLFFYSIAGRLLHQYGYSGRVEDVAAVV